MRVVQARYLVSVALNNPHFFVPSRGRLGFDDMFTITESLPAAHGSFEISVVLSAPPERVFAAYAELPLRSHWFRVPGPSATGHHELDFRVGGQEIATNTFLPFDGEPEPVGYRSTFLDIVPARRIVVAYTATVGAFRSASLATIQIEDDPEGTRLRHAEQYVFLEGDVNGTNSAHFVGSLRLQLNGLRATVED
jgi:uncharacterized protein YndB with AHSA1/START domain